MRSDILRFVPAFVLLLVSVSGCATTIRGLKHDPSFTFDSVKVSGLHVGGVVSATTELTPSEITTFSSVLRSGFLDERKDIYVHDPASFTSAIGIARRAALLAEYKNAGVVSTRLLEEIGSKIPGARYAIFARIEEDTVSKERRKEDVYHEKDKDKKKLVGQKIRTEATRRMIVSLSIYDITAGAVVWGGSVEKSRSDSRQYETRLDDNTAILLNTLNRVLNEEDKIYPYPPYPAQRDVLASIFMGFAENLPKQKK